jgi:hypothetical protein
MSVGVMKDYDPWDTKVKRGHKFTTSVERRFVISSDALDQPNVVFIINR